MTHPSDPAIEDPDELSETEKANIRMDQEFYGVTEEEDLSGLNLLDPDDAALRHRNQS